MLGRCLVTGEECIKLFSHLLVQCWFYFKLEDLPLSDHKSNFQTCLAHWSKARSGGSVCKHGPYDTKKELGHSTNLWIEVTHIKTGLLSKPSEPEFSIISSPYDIGKKTYMTIKTSLDNKQTLFRNPRVDKKRCVDKTSSPV